ncbi:MAG: S4 domain-containing protein, partial [Bosea sp. (in: a-proteobacteria)]
HGRAAAEAAAETARKTFEEGTMASDLPSVELSQGEMSAGLGLLSAFVKAGIVPSTGEARRQIKSGGLRLNDEVVTDERANLSPGDFNSDGIAKLSMGKKKHVLLKLV